MEEIEGVAQDFIGQNGLLVVLTLGALIFKSGIEKLAASLFVFWGSDFQSDDIVFIDRRPSRIVRVGPLRTVFYIYEMEGGKVVGGKKLVVQNEMLSSLQIEKPLDRIKLNTLDSNDSIQ